MTAKTVDVGLIRPGAPLPKAELPRAPGPERIDRRPTWRRRAKRIAVAVAALFIVMKAHTSLLSHALYDQRQQHLAADLGTPTPELGEGDAIGLIQIESLLVNDVVVEGLTADHLRGGPAHMTGSALPGDAGVMVIYGHRSAYGGPFGDIADLVNGDSVVLQARNGGPITRYIVDRTERDVELDDLDLPNADQIAYVVLATSEPAMFTDDLTVVVARALPVTEATSSVPDLTSPFDDAPLIDLLLALVAILGTALSVKYLRGRVMMPVTVAVVAPAALFAVLRVILLVERALPIAR